MRIKLASSVSILVLAIGFQFAFFPLANAGQLSTGGVNLTWDDKTLILPKVCGEKYSFSYQTDGTLGTGYFDLLNAYGNSVSYSLISNLPAGISQLNLCDLPTSPFVAPFAVRLTVYTLATSGGNGEPKIVSIPVSLLNQSAQSGTTPTSKDQIAALATTIAKLQKQLDAAIFKLNKVCKIRPKPKYC